MKLLKLRNALCMSALLSTAVFSTNAAQAQVVISQIYGGGGNTGATLKNDFIELRNNGTSAVNLDGWSVQYSSATGNTWQRTNLAGSIAPGGYYLIQQAQGTGGTVDLPVADAVGSIAMSGTNGKVALAKNTTLLAGTCPITEPGIADFVGFGSTANCYEGSAATVTLSNTTAALRKGDGSQDNDQNSTDFSAAPPNPRNSGSSPPPPPSEQTLSIAQIQGTGMTSPYAGNHVVTEGVITALKSNSGFFMQAINDDGNPATSDGIFVFTSSAPPAAAKVGNRVRVRGTVTEFVPSSNLDQLSITEITNPTVEQLATGVALPAPVELSVLDLGTNSQPGTLERLEGMRVSVAHSIVVAPSGGSINEKDATASSDGVFHVTLPSVARPFREPGIAVMDAIPIPSGKNPPRFDTNQERLMVRSAGQVGSSPVSVDAGATVAGLLGVLDYSSGTWALLPDPASAPAVSGGMLPRPVSDAGYDEFTIGSFNLMRLFDDVNDGNGAVTLTSAALEKRLSKAATAICDYLKAPDILGVVEVENMRVLQLLSERIDNGCARKPGYTAHLKQGNDVGGINVGFLVSSRATSDGIARVDVLEVTQYGKTDTITNPNDSTSILNDRPPLLLRARVNQDAGSHYPITVIVNHLRSLNGISDSAPGSSGWATGSERVRVKRGLQAVHLADLVQRLQQTNPSEKIVLVGDFNAFEFNDGYADVMGILKGEPAQPAQVLSHFESPLSTSLIDGSQLIADPQQRYSYVFAGNAQTLDHVLLNEALVMEADARVEHARINADFGVDNFADASLALRSSDHDPVRLSIKVPAFARADLSVAASADRSTANVGDTVNYTVNLRNAGPGAANSAVLAFAFSTQLQPVMTTLPSGWSCTAPNQTATDTRITCNSASLAANGDAAFVLQTVLPAATAGTTLGFGVSANSSVLDPENGNNTRTVPITVSRQASGSADLSLRLAGAGSTSMLSSGSTATLLVRVSNTGPDPANAVAVVVESNVQARYAAIAAPQGWVCSGVQDKADGSSASCTHNGPMPTGVQTLGFAISNKDASKRGATWEVDARVSAQTPDPNTDNNSDRKIIKVN